VSVIYRSFHTPKASFDSFWDTATSWWISAGAPDPLERDVKATFSSWTIEHRHNESSSEELHELHVENWKLGRRITFQYWVGSDESLVLIEEDRREQGGVKITLPEPMELTRQLFETHRAEDSKKLMQFPEILLVGEPGRHRAIRPLLEARLLGMSSVRETSVEEAAVVVGSRGFVVDGSIVLLLSAASNPVIIPAQWARFNLEPVARKMHRDVLQIWFHRQPSEKFSASVARLEGSNRTLEEWRDLAEDLAKENDILIEQRDWALLSQDEALAELDSAQRRLAFLERQFRERGEVVPSAEDEEEYPEDIRWSVVALKYARDYLNCLSISGSAGDHCGELDEQHSAPITARRAWRALRALNDYVTSKRDARFQGNFHDFCRETPAGFVSFPPNDVAMVESERTLAQRQLREARMFPVPTSVDPSGYVLMQAHIKVAGIGNLSARLHFFDDSQGPTGVVHIGYLGPHLPL
jgi:hypothetical protein